MTRDRPLHGLSCCILAGGMGKRLGVRKHRLARGGVSLIQRQIDVLRRVSDDVFVVVKGGARVEAKGARVVVERFRKFASVFGLLTALRNAKHDLVLLVACDMPRISLKIARRLYELSPGYDLVVPECGGELQMVFAIYRKPIASLVAARIRNGFYTLNKLVGLVDAKIVVMNSGYSKFFANVNRPPDLQKHGLTIIHT